MDELRASIKRENLLELKNSLTEIKNTLEGISSKEKMKKNGPEIWKSVMECNQGEQQKEKKIKNENRLRELCDIIKYNNIQIIGIPEGRRERKEGQKLI